MNIVEIGESMIHVCKRLQSEGKSLEEIAKLTFLPANFIAEALKDEKE
jgi:hypothetical protein